MVAHRRRAQAELLEEFIGAPLAVVEGVPVEALAAREHLAVAQLQLADVLRAVRAEHEVHHDVPPLGGRRRVDAVLDADDAERRGRFEAADDVDDVLERVTNYHVADDVADAGRVARRRGLQGALFDDARRRLERRALACVEINQCVGCTR